MKIRADLVDCTLKFYCLARSLDPLGRYWGTISLLYRYELVKKSLIASLIAISITAFAQPVKANARLTYSYAYEAVTQSKPDNRNSKEFWTYTRKWLEQDKNYPEEVARSFCAHRAAGGSKADFSELSLDKLLKRQRREGWSEARVDAYIPITAFSMVAGAKYYCPQFKL